MKGRRIYLLLIGVFLFTSFLTARAQQSKTDSLASVIAAYPKNDTVKVILMTNLAKMLAYSDPAKARNIMDNALSLAEQIHFINGILTCYNIKSSLYIIQGNLAEASHVGEQYLQLARQYHNQPALITADGLMGIIYSQNGNYSRALEYLLNALKISETIGDQTKIAAITQNIGNIYNDLEDYDKAIDYYKKSIAITNTIVPPMIVPPALYNNIGSVLIRQMKYTKAIEYLEKGESISRETNNQRSLSGALSNLSDAYHHLGDNEKAFETGNQALVISRRIGDKRTMSGSLMNVGIAISELPDPALQARNIDPRERFSIAVSKLDSALALATSVGDIMAKDEAYKDLSEISEKQKNYPLAISSLRLYSQLHDTIVNNDNQKEITRKFIQYEFDKKEADFQMEQQITEGKLKEEKLLSHQSQQQLKIEQTDLALSNKDRDLQKLSVQKEQEDLLKEKQEKKNLQILSDQKDKIQVLEIANQRRFLYGMIAGLVLLSVIGILLYRQGIHRRTANETLTFINRQLDEANKLKARFFGLLSHDLRSPIARLIDFLYLQKEAPDLLTEETAARHRQHIVHAAEDLLVTIEDLLLWSKGQMNNFHPEIRSVEVHLLFSELQRLYPGNSRIKIDFTEVQQFAIQTDKDYLNTILRNLTSNAMKALEGQANGHIIWKAYESKGNKFLSITDNGPGIPKAQQKILFNDDAAIGTKNGLGLNFVRDFANAIHCTIQVDSAPGLGTTFILGL